MVIPSKAQGPPYQPPHRPYSVARATTGRLIKQELREEPGCGPVVPAWWPSQRKAGRMGVGSEERACCPVSAYLLQSI